MFKHEILKLKLWIHFNKQDRFVVIIKQAVRGQRVE